MNSHKVAVRLAAEQTFRITLLFHPQAEVFTFDSCLCTLSLFIVFLIILLTLASQPSANIPEFRSLADFRSLSADRKLTFCEHWPFKKKKRFTTLLDSQTTSNVGTRVFKVSERQ